MLFRQEALTLSFPDRIGPMSQQPPTHRPLPPPRRRKTRAAQNAATPGAASGPVPEPDVRVGPLAPLAGLLREWQVDPAPVFAAGGLPADAFDDTQGRVPFRSGAAVLVQAAKASGRDEIGLLLGERFSVDSFGLLGGLMRQARTVGEALNDFHRFFHLQDRGAALYLSRRGPDTVALGYSVLDADTPGTAIVYDLALMVGMQLLRALAGSAFAAEEVSLIRPQPRHPSVYRRGFGAPVVFGASLAEIRFAARWLDWPVAGGGGSARAAAERAARAAEAEVVPGFATHARAVAQELLACGDVSAQRVADALGLHERTMRRRLAREGTGYHEVIAAARQELAQQLLRETPLPLAAIAAALGYADAPAFVRAFRAWAGCTPGQWRRRVAFNPPADRG